MKHRTDDWNFEVIHYRKNQPPKGRKYKSFEAAVRKTAERCILADPCDLFEIIHPNTSIQLATAKVRGGGCVDFVFNEKE